MPLRQLPRAWYAVVAVAVCPSAVTLSLFFGFDPVAWEASRPLIHRADGFVGSNACSSCHADHHASWSRTFHRTMTQRASPETVRGAFDGQPVSYAGKTARPFRRGDDFYIEVPTADGGRRSAQVTLAVGSRRYQQYFEREPRGDGFVLLRLPILWHVESQRWLHLNTVFLGPDDTNWEKYRSRWNDNCVFCHNTAPQPRELESPASAPRVFDSHVAELGIACETCHGPGSRHVRTELDPLHRLRGYLSGATPSDIVDPVQLDKERSVSACGQCHGQRLPLDDRDLFGWLTAGPSFRSGERLTDHARPLTRESPSPSARDPDLFRRRFWADGTARLTAYEYQGVVMSPCYQRGEMTCRSCHAMHGGDPRGMIEPELRGNAACATCHAEIARNLEQHTKHEAKSSGSACMECHMPRMNYGILEIHRSHRIENPDPRRDGEAGRPHACTTCHLDKSLLWAADEMARLWGGKYQRPAFRPDKAPLELPDSLASLLSGDAVQRAVYAWAAGRPDAAPRPGEKAFLRAALAATLADAYPSIRRLAQRSLLSLEQELPLGLAPQLAAWDHTDGASRERVARETLAALARQAPGRLAPPAPGMLLNQDFSADMPAVLALLNLQDERVIDIGE